MKRFPILHAAAAALALLGACAAPRPTPQDYLAVLPGIVPQMEKDGRDNAQGPPVDGPLLVDVKSFAVGARLATLDTIGRDRVARALGGPFIAAVPDSTVLCDRSQMGSGCWVKQYGVFVHLKLMQAVSKDWMQAHVSVTTTDRRAYPTNFCERIWKLDFERAGTGWRQTKKELVKSCE